jgi:hypothetical protein
VKIAYWENTPMIVSRLVRQNLMNALVGVLMESAESVPFLRDIFGVSAHQFSSISGVAHVVG